MKKIIFITIILLSESCKAEDNHYDKKYKDVNKIIKKERTSCLEEAAKYYHLNLSLLLAIIKAESNFNVDAMNYNNNGSYDCGLMQINSIHKKSVGEKLYKQVCNDPCTNVWVGAWILKSCIIKLGYNWDGIGCYHSNTPSLKQKYVNRIKAIIKGK